MIDTQSILIIIAFMTSFVSLYILLMSHKSKHFKYTITETEFIFDFKFLGMFPVRRKMLLDTVVYINVVTFIQSFMEGFKRGAYQALWGYISNKMVIIERHSGHTRTVFFTPDNPDAFAEELKRAVEKARIKKKANQAPQKGGMFG